MKKQIFILLAAILLLACKSEEGYSQDIEPVAIENNGITYRIGTSETYLRQLPAALPKYVILITMPFDLFPALSDPEIKAELISILNTFNPDQAGSDEKKHFLQNLTHLILMDIDHVEKWKRDYGQPLDALCSDNRFSNKALLVKQLMDDYINNYLPYLQSSKMEE